MTRLFFAIIFALLGYSNQLVGQDLQVVKVADLQNLISSKSDKVKVINFWATWCGPCVKELPLFEQLNADNAKAKVWLVSMDLDLNPDLGKVKSFIAKKNIRASVIALDEKDPNTWISLVDPSWSGALPATLIINDATGKRKFVEKELHAGDLDKLILEVSE